MSLCNTKYSKLIMCDSRSEWKTVTLQQIEALWVKTKTAAIASKRPWGVPVLGRDHARIYPGHQWRKQRVQNTAPTNSNVRTSLHQFQYDKSQDIFWHFSKWSDCDSEGADLRGRLAGRPEEWAWWARYKAALLWKAGNKVTTCGVISESVDIFKKTIQRSRETERSEGVQRRSGTVGERHG